MHSASSTNNCIPLISDFFSQVDNALRDRVANQHGPRNKLNPLGVNVPNLSDAAFFCTNFRLPSLYVSRGHGRGEKNICNVSMITRTALIILVLLRSFCWNGYRFCTLCLWWLILRRHTPEIPHSCAQTPGMQAVPPVVGPRRGWGPRIRNTCS